MVTKRKRQGQKAALEKRIELLERKVDVLIERYERDHNPYALKGVVIMGEVTRREEPAPSSALLKRAAED